MSDDYLSAKDACDWANISRRTLTNRIKAGDVAYEYRGRLLFVSKVDLEALYTERSSKKILGEFPSADCASNLLMEILIELREIKRCNLELAREVARLSKIESSGIASNCQDKEVESASILPHKQPAVSNSLESLPGNKAVLSTNERRAEDAKRRLFAALDEMEEMPMYRGKPSITGIHKLTGIDRGTISKYLDEYQSN